MDGVPGFTAFNVALGDSEGEVGFYRSGFSPSSSLLPMGQAHKDLFPFTSEIAVRGGLLIKIDVQGAEAQVLKKGQATIQEISGLRDECGLAFLASRSRKNPLEVEE